MKKEASVNEKLTNEQNQELKKILSEIEGKVNVENYDEMIKFLNYYVSPSLNDLSTTDIRRLENCIDKFRVNIDKKKINDGITYCNWLNKKMDINRKAREQDSEREDKENKKHFHPIRPKRGDVYLTEMGKNIGKEIKDLHPVLILQNNKGNLFSNTVICIPISASGKLYETHEKINLSDVKHGRLDKLPSKAKTEQIKYIDKARLIKKIAVLEDGTITNICERLKKNLDIQ